MKASKIISSFIRFRRLRYPNNAFFCQKLKKTATDSPATNGQLEEPQKTLRQKKVQELRKPIDPKMFETKSNFPVPSESSKRLAQNPKLTPANHLESQVEYISQLKEKNRESTKSKAHIIQKKLTLGEQLKHAWDHLKKSLVDVKNDTKIMYELRMRGRLRNLSLGDYLTYKQIQKDLLKFLPFSLFVLIPIGEIFLPFYLYLFPNATPSQFYSEKSVGQMVSAKVKIQRKAYDILRQRLRLVMSEVFTDLQNEINLILTYESTEERQQMFKELDLKMMVHLVSNWETYKKQLRFSGLTVYEKECVLGFLFKDFVSGVNLVNRTVRMPGLIASFSAKMYRKMRGIKPPKPEKTSPRPKSDAEANVSSHLNKSFHGDIKLNFPPFAQLRGLLLNLQIRHHIWNTRKQDRFLQKDALYQLESCTKQQVFRLSKARGFAHLAEQDEKEFLVDYWLQPKIANYATSEQVRMVCEKWGDWEFRFWAMVLRHNYQNHMV